MRASRSCAASLALAPLALLGACGFHLQGNYSLPRSLAVVRIDTADKQSDFYFGMRKALAASGTRIDDAGTDPSSAVLHILTDTTKETILTVSALNIPTEYELTYTVKFSLDLNGRQLIAPEQRALVRDYNYSESAQLAKQREAAILSGALARELASVVMRRLSSL